MIEFTGESGAIWFYDPDEQIGDPSGMGRVFLGRSADANPVAVKRTELHLDTEGERRRREREVEVAKVLSSVPSDHVLPTLDVGRVEDELLIVMPLAERSLAAALREVISTRPRASMPYGRSQRGSSNSQRRRCCTAT